MNSMTKIALVSASVLSIGALTACQSPHSVKDKDGDHARMIHDDRHQKHDHKMTPEQREQFKQARAERKQVFEQIQKACDNKAVGQSVQIKAGDKTIDGTCSMRFKADRQDMKRMHKEMMSMHGEMKDTQMKGGHHPLRGEMKAMQMQGMPMQSAELLTDAKRAELTKQFDQRLAQHQAHQQAILKACQGQANGKAVQIKVGTQTINGKCEVRFQPKAPVAAAPAPVKSAA
ncbi:hypothetical protein [Acinetobacter terrae]|uniref:hypothetical protein n=1 Tax=Acinetobacter terrae TaxID=2731247 RepID=UPI0007D759C1|nr:hypothetical protein [Acinetobacter terrae]NNH15801.1 hypothetical protein [Acinetobacter terrae]OAL87572.1 hypothetical protein AY608_10990 [Acinetobacter terrae]